jgi:hypothetical protein
MSVSGERDVHAEEDGLKVCLALKSLAGPFYDDDGDEGNKRPSCDERTSRIAMGSSSFKTGIHI